MIVELSVENLAIIERAQIGLGPGLTVLTGETGAGKSLLVDALELVFGARADSDLVRSGASRAAVSAVVAVEPGSQAESLCQELCIEPEEALVHLSREVGADGRSQSRIGGRLTPLSTLRKLGEALVDLHGQHDHQSLLHQETHVRFLDEWIGRPAKDIIAEVERQYETASDLRSKLTAARSGRREHEQRIALLEFQIAEIEALAPVPGEMEELEGALARLRHGEKLRETTGRALVLLSRGDASARDQVQEALKALEDASRLDPTIEAALEPLRAALYSLEDASAEASGYFERIESEPGRLEELAARADALRRMRRKYGEDETAILECLERSRRELELLTGEDSNEEELAVRLDAAERDLAETCLQLSRLRSERASEFSDLVQAELGELAIENGRLEVSLEPTAPGPRGADRVEMLFSANLGEPVRPLAKIASGGEISRVMLAIKTVMAGRGGAPTMIFDEVDAGLGGRAAGVVARKLEDLARHRQVIAISHLPQIASRASTHFRIEKDVHVGRVATRVRALDADERVREVARMLAAEEVGESALVHARQMIAADKR